MIVSFCAVLFPRGVVDEILNSIESVSEGFPSYSLKSESLVPEYSNHLENYGVIFDRKLFLVNKRNTFNRSEGLTVVSGVEL